MSDTKKKAAHESGPSQERNQGAGGSASEAAPAEPTTAAAEPVKPIEAREAVEPVEAAEATKAAKAGVLSSVESRVDLGHSDAGAVTAGLGLSCPGRHSDAGERGEDRERGYESFGLRARPAKL